MDFENKKELLISLNKAKYEFFEIKKTKTMQLPGRPAYKYADLENIMSATKEALHKHGLVLFFEHEFERKEQHMHVECNAIIAHAESCQSVYSKSVVESSFNERDNIAQKIGSLMTYSRRYAVCALFGIVADEDDDASSAASTSSSESSESRNITMSQKNYSALCEKIREFPEDFQKNIVEELKSAFNIPANKNLVSLKDSDFEKIMNKLEKIKKEMGV